MLLVLGALPVLCWVLVGEAFLSPTRKQAADVLIVEGWIGKEAVRAAAREFENGEYAYILTAGGRMKRGWEFEGAFYGELAKNELLRAGIPGEAIIFVRDEETERHRTYASALAARQELDRREIHPAALNVFTLGPHARRSRLVFAKVFGREVPVGVISWSASGESETAWWRSSERTKAMITETTGYLVEILFNGGRGSPKVREPA